MTLLWNIGAVLLGMGVALLVALAIVTLSSVGPRLLVVLVYAYIGGMVANLMGWLK